MNWNELSNFSASSAGFLPEFIVVSMSQVFTVVTEDYANAYVKMKFSLQTHSFFSPCSEKEFGYNPASTIQQNSQGTCLPNKSENI